MEESQTILEDNLSRNKQLTEQLASMVEKRKPIDEVDHTFNMLLVLCKDKNGINFEMFTQRLENLVKNKHERVQEFGNNLTQFLYSSIMTNSLFR